MTPSFVNPSHSSYAASTQRWDMVGWLKASSKLAGGTSCPWAMALSLTLLTLALALFMALYEGRLELPRHASMRIWLSVACNACSISSFSSRCFVVASELESLSAMMALHLAPQGLGNLIPCFRYVPLSLGMCSTSISVFTTSQRWYSL